MDRKVDYVSWLPKLFPPQGQWTERDYFALPESSNIIELVEGEIIMSPAPTTRYQEIVGFLYAALLAYIRTNDLGRIFIAATDVRLWKNTIRQPDVLFLSHKNAARIGKQYIDGPPDWVAEVISPGSRETDEGAKLTEYARAGIPEYWLVDPENSTLRVYTLSEDESYTLIETYKLGDVARAETIVGFTVPIDEVIPPTT